MNLYITSHSDEFSLKKHIQNISAYNVIDIDMLLNIHNFNYNNLNDCQYFLITGIIEKIITASVKRKTCKGVIYNNSYINENNSQNIINGFKSYDIFENFYIIDNYLNPHLTFLYEEIQEIVYINYISNDKIMLEN